MGAELRRRERKLREIVERALIVVAAAPSVALIPWACVSTSNSENIRGENHDEVDAGEPDVGGPMDPCSPVPYTVSTDQCGTYVRLPCGLPTGVQADTGAATCYLQLADCYKFCTGDFFTCHAAEESCTDAGVIAPDESGSVDIDCITCLGSEGRVPAGLVPLSLLRRSSLANHFVRMAHLETASIHAFKRLSDELTAYGAPRSILLGVERARRDEVRHGRAARAMARRFGGAPVRPRVMPVPHRSLVDVAIENAIEGCVRETLGAGIASFQACNAEDPDIRQMMVTIAEDETRHAALSFWIDAWAHERIDAHAKAKIAHAKLSAFARFRRLPLSDSSPKIAARLGLPTRVQLVTLIDAIGADLNLS